MQPHAMMINTRPWSKAYREIMYRVWQKQLHRKF